MAVAVVNTSLDEQNVGYAVTANAATSSVIDEVEVFTFTPNKQDGKTLIRITVGDTHGAVAFSISAGDFWMGIDPKTGSVAQATSEVIQIETAKYMQDDGTIAVTFTPASGKRLLTDHALSVELYSMV